jgi:hypothetical protein
MPEEIYVIQKDDSRANTQIRLVRGLCFTGFWRSLKHTLKAFWLLPKTYTIQYLAMKHLENTGIGKASHRSHP